MATIVNMATYPAREHILAEVLTPLSAQVDRINVILNEYNRIPDCLQGFANVYGIIPEQDLKDTGKFFPRCQPDDFVFLCDDDIVYPGNYVAEMKKLYERYRSINPIMGLHGVTYKPGFDGTPDMRWVTNFAGGYHTTYAAHQLGTGTVLCKGHQMADFEYMRSSQRYVDLRFAQHAYAKGYIMVCIARAKGWLKDMNLGDGIFEQFTVNWPPALIKDAQELLRMKRPDISKL